MIADRKLFRLKIPHRNGVLPEMLLFARLGERVAVTERRVRANRERGAAPVRVLRM